MSIRKGESWGEPGPLAPDAPVFDSDRAAGEFLSGLPSWTTSDGRPEIGLTGGDLHRSLGAPRHDAVVLRSGSGVRFPVDLGVVELDGRRDVLVAHLVATEHRSGRLWAGPTWIIVNGSFVGPYDLGPRAHPGDGRFDLTEGSLPAGQRRTGRARARTGTHVPHPDLTTRRVTTFELDGPHHVWLDGAPMGRVAGLRVECIPDAVTVVV